MGTVNDQHNWYANETNELYSARMQERDFGLRTRQRLLTMIIMDKGLQTEYENLMFAISLHLRQMYVQSEEPFSRTDSL